jgi:hypothetical protein
MSKLKNSELLWYNIHNAIESVKDFLWDTKEGLANLATWTPVIWKDRQWDYCFMYKILYKKLSLMDKHLSEYKYSEGKNLKKVKEAKDCAKRLVEDIYLLECLESLYEKYPKERNRGILEDCVDIGDGYMEYKPNKESPEFIERVECGRQADYLQSEDRKDLFNLLKIILNIGGLRRNNWKLGSIHIMT